MAGARAEMLGACERLAVGIYINKVLWVLHRGVMNSAVHICGVCVSVTINWIRKSNLLYQRLSLG